MGLGRSKGLLSRAPEAQSLHARCICVRRRSANEKSNVMSVRTHMWCCQGDSERLVGGIKSDDKA